MRTVVLGSLLGFACFVCAQQPVGDVYESGSGAGSPAQAVQNLYQLAAKITADPSSGYDPKTDHWPQADAAWQQWDNSMAQNGNALTQQQRQGLVPCAAHLGAAIDSAERGYRIQISQPGNSAAQATAKQLFAAARADFAQCNLAQALNGSQESPATAGTNPGSDPNGTPTTSSSGSNGTPPATGSEPGSPSSPSPAQPPGSKGITRTPSAPSGNGTQPPAGPDIAALDKAMNACLSEHVPYWKHQAVDPAAMATARVLFLPDAKQSTPMDELPWNSQIFLEAAAYGVQANNAHTSEYGPNSGAGLY